MPSNSSARMCDKELPYRANGVRTPPSTNASAIIDLPEMHVHATDPRRQHLYTVAPETGQHCGAVAQHGHQVGGAATDDRTSLAVRPVGVGGYQTQTTAVAEGRYERIRDGHLGVQYADDVVGRDGRLAVQRKEDVEFVGDVVAEQ